MVGGDSDWIRFGCSSLLPLCPLLLHRKHPGKSKKKSTKFQTPDLRSPMIALFHMRIKQIALTFRPTRRMPPTLRLCCGSNCAIPPVPPFHSTSCRLCFISNPIRSDQSQFKVRAVRSHLYRSTVFRRRLFSKTPKREFRILSNNSFDLNH